jgi:hypothetical protein
MPNYITSRARVPVGDLDGARREADAGLEIARATGNPSSLSSALGYEGRAWFSEDPDRALAAFDCGAALAFEEVARTLLANVDQLLTAPDSLTPPCAVTPPGPRHSLPIRLTTEHRTRSRNAPPTAVGSAERHVGRR